ncbi:hypothetical protein AVEN_139086-1, partial [Araneus ventricosus]
MKLKIQTFTCTPGFGAVRSNLRGVLLNVQPVIHDRFTPRKWRGGSPPHSILQPIHLGGSFNGSSTQTVKPYVTGHSDPLLHSLL